MPAEYGSSDGMKRPRARRSQKGASWQRDPEGMRTRILGAATKEFARFGFGGARLNRIAKTAGANKRMIYYHVGDKEALYLAVLEGAYDHIRTAERHLNLEEFGAGQAIVKLLTFTWQYFLENPEFLALLNEENQHRARHLRHSRKVKGLHSPFVALRLSLRLNSRVSPTSFPAPGASHSLTSISSCTPDSAVRTAASLTLWTAGLLAPARLS